MIAVVTDHCCQLVIKCKKAAVQKVLDTVCLSDVTDVDSQHTQAALLRNTVEKRMQYGDIGRIAMGKWGVLLVNMALLATQYGFCVGYFIFMGNTIALMFTVPSVPVTTLHNGSASNVTSPPSHSHNVPPFALIVLIPLLPLILFSYIRGVRRLGPISFMANIALFVAFLSVIGYMLSGKCCSLLSLLRLSCSCNYSFLFGILQYQLQQLQQVLNAAAHIICSVQKYSRMMRMLRRLHWLPVKYCIIIKIILLVLKVYHNMAPSY